MEDLDGRNARYQRCEKNHADKCEVVATISVMPFEVLSCETKVGFCEGPLTHGSSLSKRVSWQKEICDDARCFHQGI